MQQDVITNDPTPQGLTVTRLMNQSKIVEKMQLAKEKLEQAVPDVDSEPLSYS